MGKTQRFLNHQIHLAIVLESQASFDNIDEILSVNGIICVWLSMNFHAVPATDGGTSKH